MKNFTKIISAVLLIILFLCSCSAEKNSADLEAMDTFMHFEYYGGKDVARKLTNEAERLDKLFSATDKESDIYAVNNGENSVKVDGDTLTLVKNSLSICSKLEKGLDISIYPVVEEWGFISGDYKIPSEKKLNELLKNVDYKKIKVDRENSRISVKKGMKLDLGAVAKGYLADKSLVILKNNNVSTAILNFGGTIAAVGKKSDGSSWKVGIADPENSGDYIGYVSCFDKIIATSGGYERYFEKDTKTYIHIIDPSDGYPVDNEVTSVSIISESGILSDALSTALFVKGVKGAEKYHKAHPGFDFIIQTKDKNLYITENIAADFTLSEDYEFTVNIVKG